MSTHFLTKHLTSDKPLKFFGRITSLSEHLRESEEAGKSERRNNGKEARKGAPMTYFELIIKSNNC